MYNRISFLSLFQLLQEVEKGSGGRTRKLVAQPSFWAVDVLEKDFVLIINIKFLVLSDSFSSQYLKTCNILKVPGQEFSEYRFSFKFIEIHIFRND
jgi:hypothetical protein